jgi:hypothetical protein
VTPTGIPVGPLSEKRGTPSIPTGRSNVPSSTLSTNVTSDSDAKRSDAQWVPNWFGSSWYTFEQQGDLASYVDASTREDHDDVLVRPDDDRLPTAASRLVETVERACQDPPLVAVPRAVDFRGDPRPCGLFEPALRDHLHAVPQPAIRNQVADTRHIAREQLQVAPASLDALRIRRPHELFDSERPEEVFCGERSGARIRCLGEHRGEQV